MTTVRDPGRATLVGIVFMSVLLSRPACAHISGGRLVYDAGPRLRIQGRSFSRDFPGYTHTDLNSSGPSPEPSPRRATPHTNRGRHRPISLHCPPLACSMRRRAEVVHY